MEQYHKPNRLENYNYSSEGIYFLTLCTENRKQLLSCIVARGILDAPDVQLSSVGVFVDNAIVFLDEKWETISVLSHVIMPNHVHVLVQVHGASGMPRATDALIPKFVSSLKRFTSRKCGYRIWQKSYYGHIIRNEADYLSRLSYIENNPSKWAEDEYYPKEERL